MSRKTKLTLLNELAWALYLVVGDSEKKGFKYGPYSTAQMALKRFVKENPNDQTYIIRNKSK